MAVKINYKNFALLLLLIKVKLTFIYYLKIVSYIELLTFLIL